MDPWMQAMARGDFASAWRISDQVLRQRRRDAGRAVSLPRHLQAFWDGRPLAGKRVLVHCHHGLGDTLQFVRLLPALRRQAREVILWTQPALVGLLRGMPGVDRLEALHEGVPTIDRDADVELMELPHLLRLRADAIPPPLPYPALPSRSVAARDRPGRRRVGLAWNAGDWNPARSIPRDLLGPLAAVDGVEWVSLQFGLAPPQFAAADLACADLLEQAGRMQGLDLVVSVDTMVAHLAGTLGLPVWMLLPAACDWRWMRGRSDSPWYPTMRLFRQDAEGDWQAALEALCRALEAGDEPPGNASRSGADGARKGVSQSAAARPVPP